MTQGTVLAICIGPVAKGPMHEVKEACAIEQVGLSGDRYALGEGSFNEGSLGKRQVTLINGKFFLGTSFEYVDSRRNIVTDGIELMWLIGREFKIGEARMRGLKYCDPCGRPSTLSSKPGFMDAFHDCGGLVAEIIQGGMIRVGDAIIPPKKEY